jgi:hypothetical protein
MDLFGFGLNKRRARREILRGVRIYPLRGKSPLVQWAELFRRDIGELKGRSLRPNLYVIAGPNGAGKTTFARKFLPESVKCTEFVNADLIAGGLSPLAPEKAALHAGRVMLEKIHSLGQRGVDFGFETTLSGKTYVRLLVLY